MNKISIVFSLLSIFLVNDLYGQANTEQSATVVENKKLILTWNQVDADAHDLGEKLRAMGP